VRDVKVHAALLKISHSHEAGRPVTSGLRYRRFGATHARLVSEPHADEIGSLLQIEELLDEESRNLTLSIDILSFAVSLVFPALASDFQGRLVD
jgi:hypothetical protein